MMEIICACAVLIDAVAPRVMMSNTTVDQVIQDARRLSPVEQLHLVSVLYEDLRTQLSPRIVSLEGRWSGLSLDEAEIDGDLQELHQQSWQHLEEEIDE